MNRRRLVLGVVAGLAMLVAILLALVAVPTSAFADTTETPHGGFTPSSKKCERCHTLHEAKADQLLPLSPAQAVCYSCHNGSDATDVRDDFGETTESAAVVKSRHPVPEGEVKCADCHTPHKGPADGNPRSLSAGSAETSSGVEFCGVCHGPGSTLDGGDLVTDFKGSGHDVALQPPSGSDIPCASCHEPHGSSNLALIRTVITDSAGTTRSVEVTSSFNPLCLQCHGAPVGTFPGTAAFQMTSHSNVTTSTRASTVYPATKAQPGDCANCHDPHGAGGRPQYVRADGNQLCYACHDAAGTTKPANYSYRGTGAYAASPHNDTSGTVTNVVSSLTTGFAAWESTTLPTPSSPGTPLDAAAITALSKSDGSFARTALAQLTGQSDYQLYRFRLPDGATGLRSLGAQWTGYGSEVTGYPVSVSLWDATANSWVNYAQSMAATSSTFATTTGSPARFVDTNGYVWMLGEAKKAVDAQLVATPTVTAVAGGDVTVSWQTLGRSSSWVDYDTVAGPPYASSAGTDSMTTTHSVTFAPPVTSGIFHYRVRGTDPSAFTRSTEDTSVGLPTAVLNPVGTVKNTGNSQTTLPIAITWTMSDTTRAPYTYQLNVVGTGTTSYSYTSSWLTTTTATLNLPYGTYRSRVTAKDKDGILTVTSLPDDFAAVFEYIPGGSCPFLFTWDGTGFKFESDNFTAGRLGGTVSTGYQQPNPNDAYVVSNPPALNNGNLEFKLVEERYEVDYLDQYKLFAVDEPAGAKVYAEKAVAGKRTFPPLQSALHTTRNLHAPASVTRTDTGADVLSQVASQDATLVALNDDSEKTFTYKTLELDLGADAVTAPQVKVVMDAISEFPVTQEGIARRATFGLPQKLEVQDVDGTWRSIAATANPLPTPPEFRRPYIFDLTNAVQGTTGKVRFTFLFRTLIDYIAIDTTQDEWLTITEVPQIGANLGYHGVDLETGSEFTSAFNYGVGISAGSYYTGAYTRYGDVSPLLSAIDDKFVIMGQGDELSLTYQPLADPIEGTTRQYVFSAYGYYKDRKTDLPAEVDPLPFQGMSNYPYPATESYPTDLEHETYRTEYNTRVELGPQASAAPAAEPVLLASAASVPDSVPMHRSINTDVVRLDATYGGGQAGSCNTCHAVHGATDASGTPTPALTVAPEASTCLGNGTTACHGGPNAAGGTNIAASLTASSTPSTHHDLLPQQSAASGSKMVCSSCHNPHSDTAASPFKNPDSIGTTMTSGIADYFDGSGDFYALVGSQHDGVAPIISSFAIDVASHPATAPAFSWLTNELATSRVDLGTTPALELGAFGTDVLSTTHSVVTSDLVPGTTYYYRVRSADAVGNSSVSVVATFTPVVAPATPALNPAPSGYEWTDYTFTWGAVASTDGDPIEYQAELTNGVTTYNFGWSTAISWPVTGLAYGDWNWRVRARDSVHTYAASNWSGWSAFSNYTPSSTCPYLFTWDGAKYGFEIDLYGQGKLAIPRATGFAKPQPQEAYVLQNAPQVKDGYLDFRMVEERPEVDYMDEWALYTADVPDGYDLYTERPAQGGPEFTDLASEVHTARKDAPAPLTATWVNTGQNVLDLISASDQQRLLLNPNRNIDFTYQTIELDLTNALGAAQTKLLIDAQTMFPNSPDGYARAATFTYRTRIEVQDSTGAWVSVPATTAILAPPAEFYRPLALDVTNVWQSASRKLRLTFLYKTYIDSIRVDTSEDVPVNLTKLPLHSATLQLHGQDAVTGPGDFYQYVYGEPNSWTSYFPGNYTRFGDVTPLLATGGDDKYVIYGGGDEIAAQFEPPTATVPAGTQRQYVVFVDGWYKDPNSQCPQTVDPLPFHAMSTFPYPPTEQYPTDADHQAYQAEYNTRYEAAIPTVPVSSAGQRVAPTQPETFIQKLENLFSALIPDEATPPQTVADSRTDYSLTFTRGAQEPVRGMFSVDTDAAVVRRTLPNGTTESIPVVEGWESTGATPTLSAKGMPADATFANAATVNGAYWRTDIATVDREWNFQVMRVRLTPEQIGSSREVSFLWTGHGEPTVGYPTFASVWNFRTSQWEQIAAPRDAGTDFTASKSASQASAAFCLTCHDGVAPAGVVVPPTVPNIASQWTGTSGGAFHSGVPSSGNGGGLKAPYSRGQEVACSACHLSHGGSNLYHVPGTVNGTSGIVYTTKSPAQAKALCGSCHSGTVHDWHQACSSCHVTTTGRFGHGGDSMTPSDSSNCMACHGHNKPWQHWASDPANFDSAGCHCGVPAYAQTF